MQDTVEEILESAPRGQVNALLAAIVALLVEERETDPERSKKRKAEILLADAGLSPAQIGPILGKKPDAVRVAISRARKAANGESKSKPVKPPVKEED